MIRDILLHLRGCACAGWIGCEIKVWQVLVGHRQNIKDLPMSVMDVCASRPYQHCETAIGKKENKINNKKNRSQNKKRNRHTESWKEKNLAQLEKKTICFYFWASGQKTRKRQKILTYSSWKTTHSKPEVSVRSTLICCTHVNKWIRAHGWCKICAWWKHFHSLTPQPEWTALICCTHAWPCVIIIITMNNGRWMVQDLCPMKTFPQPSA